MKLELTYNRKTQGIGYEIIIRKTTKDRDIFIALATDFETKEVTSILDGIQKALKELNEAGDVERGE